MHDRIQQERELAQVQKLNEDSRNVKAELGELNGHQLRLNKEIESHKQERDELSDKLVGTGKGTRHSIKS